MAVVASIAIAAGFSSTYLPKVASGNPALPVIIHIHALIFTAWLAVFVAQTILVLEGRTIAIDVDRHTVTDDGVEVDDAVEESPRDIPLQRAQEDVGRHRVR